MVGYYRSGCWLSALHNAPRRSTWSTALEFSYAWLKTSNFTQSPFSSLEVLFVVSFLFFLLSVHVIFYENVEYSLMVCIVQSQRRYICDIIVGTHEASLNEGSWMNWFLVNDYQLLVLVSVFSINLSFDFEIFFIKGLVGWEIPFCIEGNWLSVLKVLFIGVFNLFGRWLRFFYGGLDFKHFIVNGSEWTMGFFD